MTEAEYEYEVFRNIPFSLSYEWLKNDFRKHADAIVSNVEGRTAIDGANGALAIFYDDMIDENGMDRLVVIVIAFMYELEHNNIEPDMAYAVNWHIEDFENGDYESLFKKNDLELLKADIAIIKDYLVGYFKEHPEALED